MYEEYRSKGCKGVFFTLTYDESHVPKNYFVDGEIYRSAPDYGYGNVSVSKGYGQPECERGVRRKYAEAPHACLSRAGLLRDDCYECNQDIIEFNNVRQPSKHRQFLSHLQRLFADYFALCSHDDSSVFNSSVGEGLSPEVCDEFVSHGVVVDDLLSSFKVDYDTGELTSKSTYERPFAELMNYRERPIVCFNSVRKQDVQLWLKRNRSRSVRENPGFSVSYFITSEYGPSTLRPHYHGVIFGATADELRPWFKDWQKHYGRIVDFADLDITKGGLNYVSKYCSKGSFEHPLCSKDFFYFYRHASSVKDLTCTEYHSKHYEKCLQWFGVDVPIVDPTFHLVSKGLGVSWTENDVPRCHEFEEIYVETPKPPVEKVYDFDSLLSGERTVADIVSEHETYLLELKDYERRFKEFEERGRSMEAWLSAFSERCHYARNHVTATGQKVVTYALPKYYREKMFGPGLRASYPNFVQCMLDKEYQQTLPPVDSPEYSGENTEMVMAMEAKEQQDLVDRFNRCVDKFKRFYEKSLL